MLELVGHLDRAKYTPRTYVVASTDKMGTQKALTAEKKQHPSSSVSGHSRGCMHASVLSAACPTLSRPNADVMQEREASGGADVSVRLIPRSREVGQSYLTSIWTTLVALWMALIIVYQERPQLVGLCRQEPPL